MANTQNKATDVNPLLKTPTTPAHPSNIPLASSIEVPAGNVTSTVAPIVSGPAVDARNAISSKAASLGKDFTGLQVSDIVFNDLATVVDGYQQAFEGCTIYYSPSTGAHEVHGEILRKYQIIPLEGLNLGLPTTDETGAPDGVGRYNHFANGASIYWHPNTGAMAVQGPVRDQWAAQGWERGALGYPIRDVFSPAAGDLAGDFQSGVIWIGSDGWVNGHAVPAGYLPAQVATMPPEQVLRAIGSQFDTMVHKSSDNIGLHPKKSLDGVSDTGYSPGFPRNREITVTINGFHDNGLVAPDTDFTVTMSVRIQAYPEIENGESVHAIHATISGIRVHAVGLASETIANRVATAIQAASDAGIRLGSSIPASAPLLSFKIGQDGSINVFLSPTLPGSLARLLIQKSIDAM